MKKTTLNNVESIPLYHMPLVRLTEVQARWNMQVGDLLASQ